MAPGVKLERIATRRWRVSVVRGHRVSSMAEGGRKRIARLAGRAVRLLHRWDLVPKDEYRRESDSGTFDMRPRLARRYVVYQHEGDPNVLSQILATFATFELAQIFLWSELDHGSLGVAILDQETSEIIVDPMPDPVRIKFPSIG
jgi:hypothetical protein